MRERKREKVGTRPRFRAHKGEGINTTMTRYRNRARVASEPFSMLRDKYLVQPRGVSGNGGVLTLLCPWLRRKGRRGNVGLKSLPCRKSDSLHGTFTEGAKVGMLPCFYGKGVCLKQCS
jgi:hypothetical protein